MLFAQTQRTRCYPLCPTLALPGLVPQILLPFLTLCNLRGTMCSLWIVPPHPLDLLAVSLPHPLAPMEGGPIHHPKCQALLRMQKRRMRNHLEMTSALEIIDGALNSRMRDHCHTVWFPSLLACLSVHRPKACCGRGIASMEGSLSHLVV